MAAEVPVEDGEAVVGPQLQGSGQFGGFSPADLRSAYGLPSEEGAGLTVAITIAYNDPKAESDLATYRSQYGLAPCTTTNGCFIKVNQRGESENDPKADSGWALETSLDLDMVSALCPKCHILLVEADSNELEDLGIAVEEAVKLGASVVSNSWAAFEFSGEAAENHYFNHPGTPILFASGDEGYGVEYPAASPDVVAVGGTSLTKDASNRGWSEVAWSGAGSGCSRYEKKPAWQKDKGCAKRSVSDVSAVSDPDTPVSAYDSYEESGWVLLGGTSVATPIMAGIEALSSSAFRAAGPSAFPHAGEGGGLFDVVKGENGVCAPQGEEGSDASYLCQADVGYDGPTGWGSPNGPQSLPVAITEASTTVSASEAILHGSVDPRGLATEFRFEYGETTAYGGSVPIPDASAGSGSGYVEVSQAIAGLKGQTPYHYRIVATNTAGTFHGVDRVFGTTAPIATTDAASAIKATNAVLHAYVDAEGLDTSYYFEYGPNTSYSFKMPVKAENVGSGTASAVVEATINELTGSETYHYRVTARNIAGVAHGEDRVFTTAPSSWAAETPPSPGESSTSLNGINCVEGSICIAVGRAWRVSLRGDGTLAELWNGEAWSVMNTPNPPGALNKGESRGWGSQLNDVSCVSATNCIAVGYYQDSVGYFEGKYKSLAEHWNGSNWSIVQVPAPASNVDAGLESVSCVSALACTAVGDFKDGSGRDKTLVERWDGSKWTIQSTPNAAGYPLSWLLGVSCSSATSCTAVGAYGETRFRVGGALAERWDGTAWTIQATPAASESFRTPELSGVSCASANACTAVGSYFALGSHGYFRILTLAEGWNGTAWTVQPTPTPRVAGTPTGREQGNLSDVSCTSAGECTATGAYYGSSSAVSQHGWRALVERLGEAGWSVLESIPVLPVPPGWWHEAGLSSVSCPSSGECSVVGNSRSGSSGGSGSELALAEHEVGLTASFSVNPASPVASQPANFDASSSRDPGGTIESYSWDFGDGFNGSGATPSHTYAHPGIYRVTLTITDSNGKVAKILHFVHAVHPWRLTVSKSGTGAGTVKGIPFAVSCAVACASAKASLPEGVRVTLTATPAVGSGFVEWSGCEVVEGVEGNVCKVTMGGVRSATARFAGIAKVIANPKTLTLEKDIGTGVGTVKAGGLTCEVSCVATEVAYTGGVEGPTPKPAALVTLTATPAAGSGFVEWNGCDVVEGVAGKICKVTMGGGKLVTAKFSGPDKALTLTKSGTGAGTVKGTPFAVNCGATCNSAIAGLPEGTVVTLTATPAVGSGFVEWSGCDEIVAGKCVVTMSNAKSVTVTFGGTAKAIVNAKTLTLEKAGTGFGKVYSSPGRITCEVACTSVSATFTGGVTGPNTKPAATVTLTATPAVGSGFVEWSGCDEIVAGKCVVAMSKVKSVTAMFER